MNRNLVKRSALTISLGLCLTGCTEPSRESQRDTAADTYCERLEACGDVGAGQRYASMDDCAIAQRDFFNDLWPADKCSDGRINEERFDSCVADLEVAECSMNIFDVLDVAEFLAKCRAQEVCIDPAN